MSTRWPGQEGHVEDTVFMMSSTGNQGVIAQRDCRLSIGTMLTIKSLGTASGAPEGLAERKLILDNSTNLTVTDAARSPARFVIDGKWRVELNSAVVNVENGDGSWSTPSLVGSGTRGIVLRGVDFSIQDKAANLSVSILLDQFANPNAPIKSTVTLSGGILRPLLQNVSIISAEIDIVHGSLILAHKENSSLDQGGFTGGANSQINIGADGKLIRLPDVDDTKTDAKYILVAPKVVNNGGLFKIEKLGSVKLLGGYKQNGGKFEGEESRVKLPAGQKLSFLGGEANFFASGASGSCEVDGDVEATNTMFTVGSNLAGATASVFCLLDITGNLFLGSGATLVVSCDVSTNGRSDAVLAHGDVIVSDAQLQVNLVNSTSTSWPTTQHDYAILTGANISGTGWASTAYFGSIFGPIWTTHGAFQTVVHIGPGGIIIE